jgi:hypothetical protein
MFVWNRFVLVRVLLVLCIAQFGCGAMPAESPASEDGPPAPSEAPCSAGDARCADAAAQLPPATPAPDRPGADPSSPAPEPDASADPVLAVVGNGFSLGGQAFDMWGIRVASGTQSQDRTDALVASLDDYAAHGVNTVTVFVQGSSGGYTDPFSVDGKTLDPLHRARLLKVLDEVRARNMVAIVGIFYQRVRPKLKDAEAVREATRTVARLVLPYRNVIINIANEQNSGLWEDTAGLFDMRDPARLIELCDVVHAEDPTRIVGAGGYDHTKNRAIGKSGKVDVLLFDTNGPEESLELYDEFVAAGVNKPIVNVELFGAWTQTPVPGVFSDSMKQTFRREVSAGRARPGLFVFAHFNNWCQASTNHYELGGDGSAGSPGVRWYFDAVKAARAAP